MLWHYSLCLIRAFVLAGRASTASCRTACPGSRPGGGGAGDRGCRGSAGRASAGTGARRVGGSPASRTPPGSRSRPPPAAPRRPRRGGRDFRWSPGGRRIRGSSVPNRSAGRRTWAPAHSCPARRRSPSGDTAAYLHNTWSQHLSIAAPAHPGRRYYPGSYYHYATGKRCVPIEFAASMW